MLVMKGMPGMLICLVLVCLVCIVSSMRRVCNFHFGGDGCKENRGMFEEGGRVGTVCMLGMLATL